MSVANSLCGSKTIITLVLFVFLVPLWFRIHVSHYLIAHCSLLLYNGLMNPRMGILSCSLKRAHHQTSTPDLPPSPATGRVCCNLSSPCLLLLPPAPVPRVPPLPRQ